MTRSLLIKIFIGLAIFSIASIYQIKKIGELSPSLSDFSQTTDISGASSYIPSARTGASRVDGKLFFCGADYSGGDVACRALAKLPEGSKITVTAATIKTVRGLVLYAMNVKFGSREIYKISPEMALQDWWTDSCISVAIISWFFVAIYILILIITAKTRS